MARRKTNLCTCPKSVTLERASSQDVDEVGDQEMHEASTQASTQGMSFLLKSLLFIQKVWVDLLKVWHFGVGYAVCLIVHFFIALPSEFR